jgi:hypothetical protein
MVTAVVCLLQPLLAQARAGWLATTSRAKIVGAGAGGLRRTWIHQNEPTVKSRASADTARLGVSSVLSSADMARVFDTAAQSTESGVQADSSVARLVTAAFVAVELAFRTSALVDVGQY